MLMSFKMNEDGELKQISEGVKATDSTIAAWCSPYEQAFKYSVEIVANNNNLPAQVTSSGNKIKFELIHYKIPPGEDEKTSPSPIINSTSLESSSSIPDVSHYPILEPPLNFIRGNSSLTFVYEANRTQEKNPKGEYTNEAGYVHAAESIRRMHR